MKFIIITAVIFVVSAMLFIGELPWLLLVVITTAHFAFFTPRPVWIRIIAAAIGCAILVAHFYGYKIYGSSPVVENRPLLDHPHRLISLLPPNIVVSEDGGRFEVPGIVFDPRVATLSPEVLEKQFNFMRGPIFFQADLSHPGGLILESRCSYTCGNTFFPMFFPKRLPRYMKTDLADYLRHHGLATGFQTK